MARRHGSVAEMSDSIDKETECTKREREPRGTEGETVRVREG
jgi:hypothetical protein